MRERDKREAAFLSNATSTATKALGSYALLFYLLWTVLLTPFAHFVYFPGCGLKKSATLPIFKILTSHIFKTISVGLVIIETAGIGFSVSCIVLFALGVLRPLIRSREKLCLY